MAGSTPIYAYSPQPGVFAWQASPIQAQTSAAIQAGLKRWMPKVSTQSGADVLATDTLAHPVKSGIVLGGIAFGVAMTAGSIIKRMLNAKNIKASWPVIIGLSAAWGLGGSLVSYASRKTQNQQILSALTRLPAGATRQALYNDPGYREFFEKDLNRAGTLLSLLV